ncbi:MAG: inositol-3-phosphate synthase, partial [Candidatus Thermoplasmatota archaeon]|nr:inositol-3-phosphate synthase [Candidatus Thermoplasmatota archaeon]
MGSIKVGILGVGNCASSLVQGLTYYAGADGDADIPGLMHPVLGGYAIDDIEIVCGFDIDARKVGKDVSEAIFSPPNSAMRVVEEVTPLDAPVLMAPVMDGVSALMEEKGEERRFVVADEDPVDAATALEEHGVEVLINYLPVGSQQATEHWMEAALEAGVSVINCIPVFIASDPKWAERFEHAGVPILGDDIKSQVGATIAHRVLANLFEARGVHLDHTYQLNVGGNTDFLTLQDESRLETKRTSKTESVQSQLKERLNDEDIRIGPSDYVPFLNDNKVAFIRLEGRGFTDAPVEIEMRLSVQDSPN